MLYQYLNASFQGAVLHNLREGQGIVVDSHLNFISSNFRNDMLEGPTLACLHGDIMIYGWFEEGRMEGINTIDSAEYKVIGRYKEGLMVGRGIVIHKTVNKVYVIENDKNSRWKVGSLSISREKQKGWESRISVVNRYIWTPNNAKLVEAQTQIKLQGTEISQFLQIMIEPAYCCLQSDYSIYFGYVGLPLNLGVTLSTNSTTFEAGLYVQPFIKGSGTQRSNPLRSTNYIHKTAFFPQFISLKQNFINLLKFVNVFQERLLNLQNSGRVIHEQQERSENALQQKLLEEFNAEGDSNRLSETIRKSVAIEKLNKSLGELLIMQQQMMRKSKQKSRQRSKDKQKWLLSEEEEDRLRLRASKRQLKQEMYAYMQQQKSHVIPRSKSRGRSSPKSILRNKQSAK